MFYRSPSLLGRRDGVPCRRGSRVGRQRCQGQQEDEDHSEASPARNPKRRGAQQASLGGHHLPGRCPAQHPGRPPPQEVRRPRRQEDRQPGVLIKTTCKILKFSRGSIEYAYIFAQKYFYLRRTILFDRFRIFLTLKMCVSR